jgi:hypothetical protein
MKKIKVFAAALAFVVAANVSAMAEPCTVTISTAETSVTITSDDCAKALQIATVVSGVLQKP